MIKITNLRMNGKRILGFNEWLVLKEIDFFLASKNITADMIQYGATPHTKEEQKRASRILRANRIVA